MVRVSKLAPHYLFACAEFGTYGRFRYCLAEGRDHSSLGNANGSLPIGQATTHRVVLSFVYPMEIASGRVRSSTDRSSTSGLRQVASP